MFRCSIAFSKEGKKMIENEFLYFIAEGSQEMCEMSDETWETQGNLRVTKLIKFSKTFGSQLIERKTF